MACTGATSSAVTIGSNGVFDAGDAGVSIALAAGENVNCTFTNTKNGSITITKVMNGGTGTFTFTGTPSGSINTNNGTVTATPPPPGNYTSTETVAAGWVLSNIACTAPGTSSVVFGHTATNGGYTVFLPGALPIAIALGAGDDVSCTFTNTKNGSITIKKVMNGGTGTFTFTGTPSGSINTNNGTVSATALPPGNYTSTETVATGWVLSNIACTGPATSTLVISQPDA